VGKNITKNLVAGLPDAAYLWDADGERTMRITPKKTGNPGSPSLIRAGLAAAALVMAVALPATAPAQNFIAPPSPVLAPAPSEPVEIRGVTHSFAPRWNASYGLGLADQTALSWDFLRYDQTLGYASGGNAMSRDNWRHFLGIEYKPVDSVALLGGIAKASGITGNKGASLSPTGYERLRLNVGARWRGESWGLDSSFCFIPTGATRFPGDSGYFPGIGDSAATYLFSITVSRRF